MALQPRVAALFLQCVATVQEQVAAVQFVAVAKVAEQSLACAVLELVDAFAEQCFVAVDVEGGEGICVADAEVVEGIGVVEE